MNKIDHMEKEEFRLISAVMSDHTGGLADVAASIIMSDDFTNDSHRQCFDGILSIIGEGATLNVNSLFVKIRKHGIKDDFVQSLVTDSTGIPNLVESYAENIRNASSERRLFELSRSIHNNIENGSSTDETLRHAQEELDKIIDKKNSNKGVADPTGKYVFARMMEAMKEGTIKKNRFSTGWGSIDKFLDGGLEYGNVDIIAGRTGMGKTSFGTNMLCNVATSGVPSLLISIEMTDMMIMRKITSSRCRIREGSIMNNTLTLDEWDSVRNMYKNDLDSTPIYIEDASNTLFQVITSIRQKVRKYGVKFVIVDYIQIIQSGSRERRDLEVGDVVNTLKALAKSLHIHIMLLSQINRGVENRTSKRPSISDLSESGKIEEAASRVFLIYRDEYYDQDSKDKNVAEIILAKNRFGQTGISRLAFLKDYTLFAELTSATP